MIKYLSMVTAIAASLYALHYASDSHYSDCRITVTLNNGDVYIAGIGDTLAEAIEGAVYPSAEWREVTFPGCHV